MIICSGCGHANGQGDAFCGSCGGFLEWDGEPVAAVPVPRPALVEVPVQHSVRVPQVEHERPAPVRPDPVDLGPADLYCGSCGAGNATGRSFCRRCGGPLADTLPDERLGWWRRMWQSLRDRSGRRRSFAAGERPEGWGTLHDASSAGGGRKRRWWRPRLPARLSLGKLALPIALLSLVGLGIAPLRAAVTGKAFGLYHGVSRVVAPRYVPVSASGATATSAQRTHDASMAIDQNTLTWWAEGHAGRGRGQKLTVRFDRPVDLSRVTVHNGAADEAFPFQPRVRSLRVTLRGRHRVIDERRVVLADVRKLQEVEVDGPDVTRVTLRIISTYAGQKGTAASLAEVGFYEKR